MDKLKRISRFALDFTLFDLLFQVLFRVSVRRILKAAAFIAIVFIAWASRPLIRDAAIAFYAHQRAGEPVEFNPDYSMSITIPPYATWGIEVNSLWLNKGIMYTVPYFAFEKIAGNPVYPDAAYFFPRAGNSSFIVGGQMVPNDWEQGGGFLMVNERYFTDPRWMDERRAFATLVHELTHVQGGVFLANGSARLESATSAATTEVLAAMCVYQNDLACGAFWDEIEGYALVSLASRLPENVYDAFADLVIRDKVESFADQKTDRFWEDNLLARREIREKYGRHPWEAHLLPGVLYGRRMDTGIGAPAGPKGEISGAYMPYDDTAALFGWPMRLFLWLTTR